MLLRLTPLLLALSLAAVAVPVTADPPEQANHGLCTAWGANGTGQENGNPENAPPFQNLQGQAEEAEQTVEEFCAEVPHPSSNGNGNGNGNGPPG